MTDVLQYIHAHIREPLFAGEVAHLFGYSRWYFCERFKRYTGKTFVEYVRYYRIQLSALEILSGAKVQEVAAAYGYDSESGFYKAFLKEYGCSPAEYRHSAVESQLHYERRRIFMFPLSERCALLREETVNRKSYQRAYLVQRNVYTVLGCGEAVQAGLTCTEAVAAGITRTLQGFRPVIMPGEMLVGFNFADPDEGCYVTNDAQGRALARENGISEEDLERYFAFCAAPPAATYPYVRVDLTAAEQQSELEGSAVGRGTDSNHTVLGYEKVLRLGFEGLLHEVEAAEVQNGALPLYAGVKKLCAAACTMGEKYAACAQQLLESGDEAYNRADLETVIAVCSRVPRHPASSFIEAVQALWFAHIVNTWEDYINANSIGRLDQILYPYYAADIERGVLTCEQAFEIICCLWIKLYRDYDVQQSCVGGTRPDGSSAVNDLSWLMLDATEQLGFIRCLSVRYGAATEKAFLKRALEVVGHVQKGVPFFFNDDIIIPALVSKGVTPEDACDYTQLGCVETVIPGKSNPHAVTGAVNLLKAIEYVLCNGRSMMYPDFAVGVPTGPLDALKTYEAFYAAVLEQIAHMCELSCGKVKKLRDAAAVNAPRPYKSLLTEGCLESGRDFNDAGAVYDYDQIMLCGIPNLADSLAVIRKFVYEEHRYTLAAFKEMLEQDFPDEAVRLECVRKAPKYGNDLDEVDAIAVDIMNAACDILEQLSEKYGLSFHAQPFTFWWMIDHGHHCAASPDGRRKGEPIAYSCSSMQGRDFNGLTALLNSIVKLPAYRAPGTTSAIVELDPKLFCDRNIDALVDILIAASRKGLCNVQFNVIDAATLIDAQRHPEHYNNLAVRVSGFSQKFNLLSPELQDHIIGRTKHTCL